MAQTPVDIKLRVLADLREMDKMQRELERTRRELRNLLGMATGAFGLGAGIGGFFAVANGIKASVNAGIAFNSQLETATIGVAAVMRQFDPERFGKFSDAMYEARDAIEVLREEAKKSPATFEALVESFQASAGIMTQAGLQTRQQVDLINQISQAVRGAGLPDWQMLQETRALITGNIDRNALVARMLNITASDITQAREQGRLYEYLTEKLRSFREAQNEAAQSLDVLKSNLQDTFQIETAEATERLFEAMKKLYIQLTDFVASDAFGDFLTMLASAAESLTGNLVDLVKWVEANDSAIKTLGETALWAGVALTGMKAARLLGGTLGATSFGGLMAQSGKMGIRQFFKDLPMLLNLGFGGLTGTFQNAGSNLGKVMAKPLSAAIVVGIGAAVITGVANAIKDQQEQTRRQVLALMNQTKEVQESMWKALSPEDLDAVMKLAEERLADAQAKIDAFNESVKTAQSATPSGGIEGEFGVSFGSVSDRAPTKGKVVEQAEANVEYLNQIIRHIKEEKDAILELNRADAEAARLKAESLAQQKNERDLVNELGQQRKELEEQAKKLMQADWERHASAVERLAKISEQEQESAQLYEKELQTIQAVYEREKALADSADAALIAERRRDDAAAAADAKHKARLLELKKVREDLEAQRDKQSRDAIESEVELATAIRQRALSQLRYEREILELQPESQEKRERLNELLKAERAILEDLIRLWRTYADSEGLNPMDKEQALGRAQGYEQELGKSGMGSIPRQSRLDQAREGYNNLGDSSYHYQGLDEAALGAIYDHLAEMGTLADQLHDSFMRILDTLQGGISNALFDAITKTKSWGEAGRAAAIALGESMLKALTDIAAQMVMNFVLGETLKQKDTASNIAKGVADFAAAAPAAIATSISSYGVAAAIGLAAVIAAIAAFSGGFAEGGYTGPGAKWEPKGIVHAGENVFSQADIARWGGPAVVERLRLGGPDVLHEPAKLPGISGNGGPGARGPEASSPSIQVALVDNRRDADRLRQDPAFETLVIETVRRNRHNLF